MSRRSASPSPPLDAVIVGAGVIGLAVAWRAARRGLSVLVLERGEAGGGVSRVAAGMIAPVSEALATERELLGLGLASARVYPSFVEELREDSGHDPGLRAPGALMVARDGDEAEALERERALREELGLTVRRVLGSEARAIEPALARVRVALEVPDDLAVDPRALCAALREGAERRGADVRAGASVASLYAPQGVVRGVQLSDGERIEACQTVIAAGADAGAIAGLPAHVVRALRPVKGQLMILRDPAGPGYLERVIRMADGYVVPRGDGRYVLGATVEERGHDRTVTAGGLYGLLRDALEILPGLDEMILEEALAGLRPGTLDNAPVIGAGALEGLVWAVGHYRHGVLLAPATAELITAGLVAEDPPPALAAGLAAFVPDRFAPVAAC